MIRMIRMTRQAWHWYLPRYLPGITSLQIALGFFAEHSSLQSTLLCRALFFAERTSLQSALALLCRTHFFAEHFFAEHTSLQSTLALLCRALFFAGRTSSSLQSTLLCRAHLRFFAEHTSLQSRLALLCRAHFFSTLSICRADQALSLEGVKWILFRHSSVQETTSSCEGFEILRAGVWLQHNDPEICAATWPRLHFKRGQALPKETLFHFLGPFFGDNVFFFFS